MLNHNRRIPLARRTLPLVRRAGLAMAAALLLAHGIARAADLAPGFRDEVLPFTFDTPTKLAFLPDGSLLVAEKRGTLYLVEGATRTVVWAGDDEVLNTDDRGLLSVAVDPDFRNNRALYLLYVCDPDSNGSEFDNFLDAYGRLTRYTLLPGGGMVDPASRTVLIGADWPDAFISASGSHTVGDLEWGLDGSLFVSCGDGAHFTYCDIGGEDPGQFAPGRSDPAEDIGAFRAQSLTSLSGKVLRINPASGCGLPGNPFWDGDSTSKRSRVWLSGLRNPFRMTRIPGTGSRNPSDHDPGALVVADVGWYRWEELNVAPTGGLNFGWPCYEGFWPQALYPDVTPPSHGCETVGGDADPTVLAAPWISLSHEEWAISMPPGVQGVVMIGGVFYTGRRYPPIYRGRYFFGDYDRNVIRVAKPYVPGVPPEITTFSENPDGPVSFAVDPISGDVFYAAIFTGEIHRIRCEATLLEAEPVAATPLALSAPRPNPGRGAITLTLSLPAGQEVGWDVLDVAGRRVWTSGTTWREAGEHPLRWPGVNQDGGPAQAGLYLVRVRAGGTTLIQRCALLH